MLFNKSYFDDLQDLGYDDVAVLLLDIHTRRNQFSHGSPQAIDDATVLALVAGIKREHEAWIAAFNMRATRKCNHGSNRPI